MTDDMDGEVERLNRMADVVELATQEISDARCDINDLEDELHAERRTRVAQIFLLIAGLLFAVGLGTYAVILTGRLDETIGQLDELVEVKQYEQCLDTNESRENVRKLGTITVDRIAGEDPTEDIEARIDSYNKEIYDLFPPRDCEPLRPEQG